jgi:uncharacterized protein (DUF2235 family)
MHNYEPGDQLFLFGFSRGAFTARSLVGLIRNCGLLHKLHADQLEPRPTIQRCPTTAVAPGSLTSHDTYWK